MNYPTVNGVTQHPMINSHVPTGHRPTFVSFNIGSTEFTKFLFLMTIRL